MASKSDLLKLQESVGSSIRQQRKTAGMSLRDLEKTTGIGRGHLSNFENGKINLTLETLKKLSDAINCPIATFFNGL